MNINELRLKRDQRGVIIGQSGTGKSVLAKYLLPSTGRLGIVDPKRMFDYKQNVRIYSSADWLLFERPDRFIYRPKPDNMGNIYDYNRIYKYMYDRGNYFGYTDDMVGVMDRSNFPYYLRICYQMGREKNVAMLSSFQRPAWVPVFTVSEASKFYVFTLVSGQDCKKIREFLDGYDPDKIGDQHVFYYRSLFGGKQSGQYLKLDLSTA